MANIKIRLEVATHKGREHLKTFESAAVPRVGESVRTDDRQTFEVVDVVHTPTLGEWDVVVILKAVSVATIMCFLAA